jgi:hypothetical protein
MGFILPWPHQRKANHFTVVVELRAEAPDAIIGETSRRLGSDTWIGEFAISAADGWRRQGPDPALLCAVQSRAVSSRRRRIGGQAI